MRSDGTRSFLNLLRPVCVVLLMLLHSATIASDKTQPDVEHKPGKVDLLQFEFEQAQMGIPFRMLLLAPDYASAEAAAKAAFQRIETLNQILSDYETDSELSQLSRTSGKSNAVPVSAELWTVLVAAQALAERTEGAFDISIGPAISLWRWGRRNQRLPPPDRLSQAMESVGYKHVVLDFTNRTVLLKRPYMRLDLGGIAKGYAIDEALETLKQHGIQRALVAGSGDIAVSNPPPGKPGWRIEITSSDLPNAGKSQFVLLRNEAIATSGDLFQRIEINGNRYSHIIDPRTGIGLTNRALVTVIAPDCMSADSLATAASVLGPRDGLRLVERTKNAEARIVFPHNGNVEALQTRHFERKLADAALNATDSDPRTEMNTPCP